MTDLDVLKMSFEMLDEVELPVKMIPSVGRTISTVSENLKVLYSSIVEKISKKVQDQDENSEDNNPNEKEPVENVEPSKHLFADGEPIDPS